MKKRATNTFVQGPMRAGGNNVKTFDQITKTNGQSIPVTLRARKIISKGKSSMSPYLDGNSIESGRGKFFTNFSR